MGLAFSVAPHMADAFLDDDAPAVMATPGPIRPAPNPAVSREVASRGPGKPCASKPHQNRASGPRLCQIGPGRIPLSADSKTVTRSVAADTVAQHRLLFLRRHGRPAAVSGLSDLLYISGRRCSRNQSGFGSAGTDSISLSVFAVHLIKWWARKTCVRNR